MDFSRYGEPSADWLASVVAAQRAHPAEAVVQRAEPDILAIRAAANGAAEAKAARQLDARGLRDRVAIDTVYVPSSDTSDTSSEGAEEAEGAETQTRRRMIPIRRFLPKKEATAAAAAAAAAAGGASRGGEEEEDTPPLPLPTVVTFHGGGYLIGSETSVDYTGARTAADAGVALLSVIYRHTPEHAHPAQLDDARDAFEYICAHPERLGVDPSRGLAVIGTSAGGGLAAALVLRELELQRERERAATTTSATKMNNKMRIRGVVLFAPWLLHVDAYPFERFASPEVASKTQCRDAPWRTLKMLSDLVAVPADDGRCANIPLRPDADLRGWPRTAFVVCGMDPLRDDALLFATRLEELRTPTSVDIFVGLPHGFQGWPDLPATEQSEHVLTRAVRWALDMDAGQEDKEEERKEEGKDSRGWREH